MSYFFLCQVRHLEPLLRHLIPLIAPGTRVISTAKGIEADTFKLMSEILGRRAYPKSRVGVISGPNLAKEIAKKAITATVVASTDEEFVRQKYNPY